MNKDDLMHLVSVYANNVEISICDSSANAATKDLAREIAEETCSVLSAIIEGLSC